MDILKELSEELDHIIQGSKCNYSLSEKKLSDEQINEELISHILDITKGDFYFVYGDKEFTHNCLFN